MAAKTTKTTKTTKWSAHTGRRIALAAGGLALVGIVTLTACSSTEKPAEAPNPSSSTPAPTEKAAGPGGSAPGANSFSPTVKARTGPTALPGNAGVGG